MADVLSLGLIVGTSTLINTVNAVDKGKDVGSTLMAGGVSYVALTVFGGVTKRYDLAMAVATVFLVSAVIFRGLPILQKAGLLAQNRPRHSDNTPSSRPQHGGTLGRPNPATATASSVTQEKARNAVLRNNVRK